jgi:hypothetical protein
VVEVVRRRRRRWWWFRGLHKSSSEEDDGVDQTDNPLISSLAIDTQSLVEGQVSTVGTSLIPSLGSSTDGTKTNRVPQHLGAVPLVVPLVAEGGTLLGKQRLDELKLLGATCDKSATGKEVCIPSHAIGLGKEAGVVGDISFGHALRETVSKKKEKKRS